MRTRGRAVAPWALLAVLVYVFALNPIFTAINDDGEDDPGSDDCRVTDYQPYGSLPASTPFETRTCTEEGDRNFLISKMELDQLRYNQVVGYVCRDGSRSNSREAQGACSYHGGIRSTIYFNTQTNQYSVAP